MFHGRAESGPETASGDKLVVVGAGIVVGSERRSGSQVGLSQKHGGNQERVVVVLLVSREDKVVQNLAAGYRRVVAHQGIDEASAVLEVAVVADNELHRSAGVEYLASVAHDSVYEYDVLPNLGRLALGRVDGDVLQLGGAFDIAGLPYPDILEDGRILYHAAAAYGAVIAAMAVDRFLGDFQELLPERRVVYVLRPHIGIRGDHSVEGAHLAGARLVHQVYPYAHAFRLSVLDDAVAEFRVVGGTHLLNVEEHTPVTDDVVREIMDIVDRAIVPYVAAVDGRIADSDRKPQIVELESAPRHAPDSDSPVELVAAEHRGVEFIRNVERIPAGGEIVVLHQLLYL